METIIDAVIILLALVFLASALIYAAWETRDDRRRAARMDARDEWEESRLRDRDNWLAS